MPNAWGLVTSWMRCSPTRSWVSPPGSVRTVCLSQTLSKRLLPMSDLYFGKRAPGDDLSKVKDSFIYVKLGFMIDPSLVPALQDVLMVARVGSVGAASRQLHKTASAVSQQIRRVERHFGVLLFERAGRGVKLSQAGESALPSINRLFDEAEALFGHLAELAGTSVTTLRIAASDYLGKALLMPVMRELFVLRAPLRFEITTMHSLDAPRPVERGEVDFAVITTLEARESLTERVLFTQLFFWVGPRVRGEKRYLTDRLRRESILRLAAGSQGRRLLDAFLDDKRIRSISTIDVP